MPTTEQQPHDTTLSDHRLVHSLDLQIDEQRSRALNMHVLPETGIFVRARNPRDNNFYSVDITCLDAASLSQWLNREDGLSERVVMMLLQHGRG